MPNGEGPKDIKTPKDGRGIKWSTLKQKRRKVKLGNGDEMELPVTWRAFSPNPSGEYVGYEVELDDGRTIQVWVLILGTEPPGGDYKGWCHGLTFDDVIYSPGGEAVPAILAAAWKEIKCPDAKKGDIIVYYDPKGNVTHSATSNGDGTYKSKGGNMPQKDNETEASMDKTYKVPPGSKKCYTKKK